MQRVGLSDLVAPLDVASFVADTWGRAPRHFVGSLRDRVDDVFDLERLEEVLATTIDAADGWLHLASGTRQPIPPRLIDHEGMLNMAQVRAELEAGQSLYLTKAERLSPSLMLVARALQVDLVAVNVHVRGWVNAHVFLTPPRSQAFVPHRDEHASFVVQVEGTKEWTLYSMATTSTIAGAADEAELEMADRRTYQLVPGDVLYMPEGCVHGASTGDEHSLHVTLRVFPLRWRDVVEELSALHPALDEAIGPELEPTLWATRLDEIMSSPQFRGPFDEVVRSVARAHQVPATSISRDGLRQSLEIDRIRPDTRLDRVDGMSCALHDEGDEVVLAFPGGAIRADQHLRPAFEFVKNATSFRPLDLPLPGATPADHVVLARRFVSAGVLRAVATDGDDGD